MKMQDKINDPKLFHKGLIKLGIDIALFIIGWIILRRL